VLVRTVALVIVRRMLGVLGARELAEFGDDKNRYADARARKNHAGTSPITRQSGKRKIVLARYVHNDRLVRHEARCDRVEVRDHHRWVVAATRLKLGAA
jgi:hypothetical protein